MQAEAALMNEVLKGAERVRKTEIVHDGVVLLNGAELVPQPIQWLWDGWLALGKVHILAGAPGQGKTTIAMGMSATVTIGGRWPDGSRCAPGNVLIWSGEDDPTDTLLPRLIAAGADRARCYFVTGTRVDGELQPFDPARDMAQLACEAARIGDVCLVVVDPIVSAVAGDSHRNTETRRALQPLVDLAASMNAALLGITHFSKGGQGQDPASRINGSIAFTAVARIVMVAAKVKSEDGDTRRILARAKSNLGPDEGGHEYDLAQAEVLPGIYGSRIEWGSSVAGSARELLTDPAEQDSDEDGRTSAIDRAIEFLKETLGSDIVPCKTVQSEAKDAGVSWASVRRAADVIRVTRKKGADGWYWKLPQSAHDAQGVQDAQGAQEIKTIFSEHLAQKRQDAQEIGQDAHSKNLSTLNPLSILPQSGAYAGGGEYRSPSAAGLAQDLGGNP